MVVMSALIYKQLFEIEQITPDPRQYNQQRQIYRPQNAVVAVELEINKENFYIPKELFEQFTLAELGQGDWPKVPEHLDYTPLGWARVMEQLEEPYRQSSDWNEDDEDDEFDDAWKE